MYGSGYYNNTPVREKFPTVMNQQVASFFSEGLHSNGAKALEDVTKQLTDHLAELANTYGNKPQVISISHNSGYTDVTRFHASVVAVISVR